MALIKHNNVLTLPLITNEPRQRRPCAGGVDLVLTNDRYGREVYSNYVKEVFSSNAAILVMRCPIVLVLIVVYANGFLVIIPKPTYISHIIESRVLEMFVMSCDHVCLRVL